MSRHQLNVATSTQCLNIGKAMSRHRLGMATSISNVATSDLSIKVETLQSSVATSTQCHNINSMSQHRKSNVATSELIYNTESQCRDIITTLTYHWKLRIALYIFNVATLDVTHDIDNYDVATSPRHKQLG